MARDGSGNYTRPVSDYVFEATISETDMNTEMGQVATALTDSLTANGEKKWSGNQDANSAAKIINLNQGSARTDSVRLDQVQDGDFIWGGTATGTDTITFNLSPAITALATGMRVAFVSAGANTGAVTVNPNSTGAVAVTKNGTTALAAGDIPSGAIVCIQYDGTQWQLLNVDTDTQIDNILAGTTSFTQLNADNLRLDGNSLTSTDSAGDINITPDTTGDLVLDGQKWPQADGSAKQFQTTDGAGQLSYSNADDLWTKSGSIDLTSGSPTAVTLASSLSNVSEIEIHIEDISTNSANTAPMIQIGDSGGLEITGYSGVGFASLGGHVRTSNSSGFMLAGDSDFDAAITANIFVTLRHMGSNVWSLSAVGDQSDRVCGGTGLKTLSGALDRVSITTAAGTATFDGGTAYLRSR